MGKREGVYGFCIRYVLPICAVRVLLLQAHCFVSVQCGAGSHACEVLWPLQLSCWRWVKMVMTCCFVPCVHSYAEIYRYYEVGYQYAAKLHADGQFAHYELAEVLLQVRGLGRFCFGFFASQLCTDARPCVAATVLCCAVLWQWFERPF